MDQQIINDAAGRKRGYIETRTDGTLRALDAAGRTLGCYDPARDMTFDPAGRTIARGNVLAALIPQA